MRRQILLVSFAAVLGGTARADGPAPLVEPPEPSPDEPLAKDFSLAKAVGFLDVTAVLWTRDHHCGTCHTNYPYVMARSALMDIPGSGYEEVRGFIEHTLLTPDNRKHSPDYIPTHVVATAAVLAFADAQTTGKVSAATRTALARMWELQRPDGSWHWAKCPSSGGWPPLESDDEFGAHMAALAVSVAPENYANTEAARAGLKKLRAYLDTFTAPGLHSRALRLWAASRMDGLLSKKGKQDTIKSLLAAQRPDGGWNLPSLGSYTRHDGTPNRSDGPSDGYGTGLVVYVLRQAGVAATDPAIRKGIGWLKTHQRTSGRWFTRSLSEDEEHYISNAGTAYAVLALRSCEKAR